MRNCSLNDNHSVTTAVAVLEAGGLVIAPSDTVYGLLVDAQNEEAVKKLITFKNRPIGKSISVFVSDQRMLYEYVAVDEQQKKVLEQLLPGPFTIVLPAHHKTSRLIESEKGTLGVRIPDYSFIQELTKAFGRPITATSANLSGKSPHHSVESLLHQLPESKQKLIDLIVDGGKLPRNKPSTVIDLSGPDVKILRHGDIVLENNQAFVSQTPTQTQKIAQYILDKVTKQKKEAKPIVMILKGELGVGKTQFVKGIAAKLGVEETIISPTFTIYYEYPVKNNTLYNNLYHFDLYNIEEEEEFKHLGIEELLKAKNLLCFEWGEKSGSIFETFKEKATIVMVEIEYINQKERRIKVQY